MKLMHKITHKSNTYTNKTRNNIVITRGIGLYFVSSWID